MAASLSSIGSISSQLLKASIPVRKAGGKPRRCSVIPIMVSMASVEAEGYCMMPVKYRATVLDLFSAISFRLADPLVRRACMSQGRSV
jgi:hypothetical protein